MFSCIQNVYIESCIHYVYRKGFKIGIQNVYMILNAENVKCIHFVYIIVYIIYTAMYTLCTFSCIHFVCITSVRARQPINSETEFAKASQGPVDEFIVRAGEI